MPGYGEPCVELISALSLRDPLKAEEAEAGPETQASNPAQQVTDEDRAHARLRS